MTPNYDRAATAAAETLIKHNITAAPIMPLPILKSIPGVLVVSFAEIASRMGVDRANVLDTFNAENRDVITSVRNINGRLCYVVAYNQRLPFYMLQRSIARELGHIVLGHDGSRPEDVREAEALCFARHLICPRPLIKSLQAAGVIITIETLGNITGCYERCLIGLRKTPGAHVPAEVNMQVKWLFMDYVENYVNFKPAMIDEEDTSPVDFGTFMDNYEE